MTIDKRVHFLMIACLTVVLLPSLASGADSDAALGLGALRGVALDTSGHPLAKVSVAIRSLYGAVDRRVTSDGEGVFVTEGLKPGPYQIAVLNPGDSNQPATTLEVAPNRTVRPYLVVAAATPGAPTTAPAAAVAPLTIEQELAAMKERIAVLEAELKARSSVAAAAPLNASTAEQQAALQGPDPKRQAGGQTPTPAPPMPIAPQAHIPEALEAPEPAPGADTFTPFAFGDFTWLNGSPRNKDTVLDTKFFTPEVRFDTHYMEDFNHPKDHTIVGATESFRSGEVQIEQASIGGDFHWQSVRGRILLMFGMFATTTPRNDASFGVGQWDLRGAYKYVSEAWGGYHFNVNHGLNVDAGIFVSYIGLFSYYNFDNWTYQPSYVSSNTPWFFNGVRVQWYPTNKLKIELWFINGWQSYANSTAIRAWEGSFCGCQRNG
jgi:hypothetical protein